MTLEKMIILESNLHNYVKSHKSLDGLTPSDVYWKGLDPPFNQSNFTTEKITKWFPKVETDLEVYITI